MLQQEEMETMTQDEFIEAFWQKPENAALLETELGQNGQFDELAYVAWDERQGGTNND